MKRFYKSELYFSKLIVELKNRKPGTDFHNLKSLSIKNQIKYGYQNNKARCVGGGSSLKSKNRKRGNLMNLSKKRY